MKRLLIIFLLFPYTLLSQEDTSQAIQPSESANGLSAGVVLSDAIGVNANNSPKGLQNQVNISSIPTFGLSLYQPLSLDVNFGLLGELKYTSFAFNFKGFHSDEKYANRYSYLTLTPSIFLRGFTFGFAFGLPLGGKCGDLNINSGDLSIYSALNIGGRIPIYNDTSGRLELTIDGSYSLSGLYKKWTSSSMPKNIYSETDAYNDPLSEARIDKEQNPRIASISFGIAYYFNIRKK